ncbi:MAG: 2-phosphosulfolactate phosphatase [Usitatibacteraceae bacterium]
MGKIELQIVQGTAAEYPQADINIVIDVIRAFTVSHLAFLRGAREIFLVNTVDEAFRLRDQQPDYLLAGEVAGLPIAGFDLDNSPYTFSTANVTNRSLVQKTTNGVKATLLALNAQIILVTGLSNAKQTALHARQIALGMSQCKVNVIASHGQDDDDLACAEYIRDILLGTNAIDISEIQNRIKASRPAQKFYDPNTPGFDERDIAFCTREVPSDFVMQVDTDSSRPRILKVPSSAR